MRFVSIVLGLGICLLFVTLAWPYLRPGTSRPAPLEFIYQRVAFTPIGSSLEQVLGASTENGTFSASRLGHSLTSSITARVNTMISQHMIRLLKDRYTSLPPETKLVIMEIISTSLPAEDLAEQSSNSAERND